MGPLQGIRVVELGVWVAGPAAGCLLSDWGADVIKIEPTLVGDPARTFSRMLGGDLPFNPPFEMDNRGKRSIALDLRTEEGLALGMELLADADVFVTNVRTKALDRLGIGFEQVAERFPRLVYALITGFGTEGPDKDRAAYDIAGFWARSGIAHMLTQPGSHPPFQRGGMGDHGTGLAAAGAICAALFARERSSKGQLVTTSLLRQGIYTLSFDLAIASRYGMGLAVGERASMGNPLINNYHDKDGRWFWLVGLEGDRHWPSLARAVGHPEWIDDERFNTLLKRSEYATELIAMLDEIFATKTREEWGEIFDAQEALWWAPVQSLEEVLVDEQVHACGGLCEVPDGDSTTLLPATPADFHGTPWAPTSMAPSLGQHTDEILEELGRGGDIVALRDKGVVV
jgi:crotonobetainyl-CoA:carnitine CoA-transferase CaiB-like acyl-CoA transferase